MVRRCLIKLAIISSRTSRSGTEPASQVRGSEESSCPTCARNADMPAPDGTSVLFSSTLDFLLCPLATLQYNSKKSSGRASSSFDLAIHEPHRNRTEVASASDNTEFTTVETLVFDKCLFGQKSEVGRFITW